MRRLAKDFLPFWKHRHAAILGVALRKQEHSYTRKRMLESAPQTDS